MSIQNVQLNAARRPADIRAVRSIAMISSYVPRACGIATFTCDLVRALAAESPSTRTAVVALNDIVDSYDYPPEVEFQIAESTLADYRRAAEYLNTNGIEVACLQHEYGLFGGVGGDHIIKLIRELRMPVVATLHSILQEPSPVQKRVLCDIADVCARLVTMTETGRRFLREIYDVPDERIVVIPHGVPDTPFLDSEYYKDQLGFSGRTVILTFGLLSPGKGIETLINALPRIAEKHPDVLYVVLGATHPKLKRQQGETYRHELQRLSRRLGVDDRVVFHDRFVELHELCEYLGAADVYVTPYLSRNQITSGTLAYAMATGKAIVSTPYWHAEEALADGRGRLFPFGDADALAEAVIAMLSDDDARNEMRHRAYAYARSHVWKEVARRYLTLFDDVRRQPPRRARYTAPTLRSGASLLPELKTVHLQRMTDDVGMLQHAIYNIPRREDGYCVDDNARALLVTYMLRPHTDDTAPLVELGKRYLSFTRHAFNPETRRFRNFMSYDRRWLEDRGSEDSHARALWALGVTVAEADDEEDRTLARELMLAALPGIADVEYPRAAAHVVLGLHAFLNYAADHDGAVQTRDRHAESILNRFREAAEPDWYWLEDRLTYSNATIPHALIVSGAARGSSEMLETGLRALTWLTQLQMDDDHFVPIGNRGWYVRGQTRARYDQQPI
ncbi:MAG: glycosyltransferase, partial [Planctomycetota bacterium]